MKKKKSILPLSGKEENMKKQAVKTTIVGGQPPGNERPLQKVPVGIEQLLAMAAVDNEFAAALMNDHESATAASGVELTQTEKGILSSIPAPALKQMIGNVRGRIPAKERRAFLKKSAAALLALVSGGILTTAGLAEGDPGAAGGVRPDSPKTKGISPDRPPVKPRPPIDTTSRSTIPTWTETVGTDPKDAEKTSVFDYFSRVSINKDAAPFAIYFYTPGTNEKDKDVNKCVEFEKALDEASEVRKAMMDYGRYVCDASKLYDKIIKKFSIKTPSIIIFDGKGKEVYTIKKIPKDTDALIKKLEKIKKDSDKACDIKPEKKDDSRAKGGIRADRPRPRPEPLDD
ncbi:MAG: hypothetical protein ACYS8W_09920 [Planctomycetota bacterium]|jgi:hypothetical protein